MTDIRNVPMGSLGYIQQDCEQQQTDSSLAVMQADMRKALQQMQEEGDTEIAASPALSDIPAAAPANLKDLDE